MSRRKGRGRGAGRRGGGGGGPWHGREGGGGRRDESDEGGGSRHPAIVSVVPFAELEGLPQAFANALRAMGQAHAVGDLADVAWEWLTADAEYRRDLEIFFSSPPLLHAAVVAQQKKDAYRGVLRG